MRTCMATKNKMMRGGEGYHNGYARLVTFRERERDKERKISAACHGVREGCRLRRGSIGLPHRDDGDGL